MRRPKFKAFLGGVALLTAFALTGTILSAQPATTLDYEFFKNRIEPIFLAKRHEHARCYVCHVESNNAFRLERLSPGSQAWTEEQSRRNFEVVAKLVNPGDPETSRLLLHPLAPESGGDVFHSGGRQFRTKFDPAWHTLAAWVSGATLAPRKK